MSGNGVSIVGHLVVGCWWLAFPVAGACIFALALCRTAARQPDQTWLFDAPEFPATLAHIAHHEAATWDDEWLAFNQGGAA